MRKLALRLFIDAESTKAVRIWSRTRASRGCTLLMPQKGPIYATLSSQELACSRASAIPRMHTNTTADHCRCADLKSNAVHNDERGIVLQNIGKVLEGSSSEATLILSVTPLANGRSVTAVSSGGILFRFFARDRMAPACFSIILVLGFFCFFLLSSPGVSLLTYGRR